MAQERFQREIGRLRTPPSGGQAPGGLGTVQVVAACPGSAAEVLARTREVFAVISERSGADWPPPEQWESILPKWFVSRCAPPMTAEQAREYLAWWRKLTPGQQAQAEQDKDWSLEDWLYWMEPANRCWTW